jgi:O-antigen/teichoic acid export membrane protein
MVGVTLNVGFAIGGITIARLMGTVTQIMLARLMVVADFGLYTMLYTLLGTVIIVTGLGLDTWLLRQSADGNTLDTAISQIFSLRLLASGMLMIFSIPLVLATGYTGVTLPLVLVVASGLTCELLLSTGYTALRAQLQNQASTLLQVSVACLIPLLTWLFWSAGAPVLSAASYRLLADLAGLLLLIWLLRSHLCLIWQPARLKAMLRQTRVFFASDILAHMTLKADLTLVALLMGALAAGIYSPVLTIINTTFLVPGVIWQVLLPIVARQQPDSSRFRWTVGLALVTSLFYGLICAITFWLGAEWIIQSFYGEDYRESARLLQIMGLIPLLKSINFCWAMLMVARDRQVLRTRLQVIGVIFNITGNLILIPVLGLTGVAWINLSTEVVLLLCYSYGIWMTLHR